MLRAKFDNTFLRNGIKIAICLVILVAAFAPLVNGGNTPVAQAARSCNGNDTLHQNISTGEYYCLKAGAVSVFGNTYAPNGGDKDGICNSLSSCVAGFVYVFAVGLGSAVAYIGAWVLSLGVALSLSSTAYGLTFITTGWTSVRDLANMAFILILIYIAITIMLQAESGDTMKQLAAVIFVALIINFSFFLTRVVIDTGNIVALQFYNAIVSRSAPLTESALSSSTGLAPNTQASASVVGAHEGVRDLTSSIMDGIGFQTLLSNESFQQFQKSNNAGGLGSWQELIALVFLYLAAGTALFILAAGFLAVGIKFIVRTVVLWLLIIASPAALIARAIPGFKKYYDDWQKELIRHAFYPAIFLFVFFILVLFMNAIPEGNIVTAVFSGNKDLKLEGFPAIVSLIASLGVYLGFVIALLHYGMKAADGFGIYGGKVVDRYTSKIPFFGGLSSAQNIGRRAGGVAFQQTVGRHGYEYNEMLKANPPKTKFGQFLDYNWRKRVLEPAANKKVGGVASFADVKKSQKEIGKDWSTNLGAAQNHKDVEELKKIPFDKERYEQLDARWNKRETLNPKDARDYYDMKQIKPRHDELQEKVSEFRKPQLESLKASEIEGIVKYLKESQLKTLKDSEKFSEQEKDKFEAGWHKESPDAPVQKSKKIVGELRKANLLLKDVNENFKYKFDELIKQGRRMDKRTAEELRSVVQDSQSHLQTRLRDLSEDLSNQKRQLGSLNNDQRALDAQRRRVAADPNATEAQRRALEDDQRALDAQQQQVKQQVDDIKSKITQAQTIVANHREALDSIKKMDENRSNISAKHTDTNEAGSFTS